MRYGAKRALWLGMRRGCGAHEGGGQMVRFAMMYVQSFVRKEEGQDLVEYALLVGLIVLGSVALMTTAGDRVFDIFTDIVAGLTDAANQN
jgi:Flp pilus assembly pilin Flp